MRVMQHYYAYGDPYIIGVYLRGLKFRMLYITGVYTKKAATRVSNTKAKFNTLFLEKS